MFRHEYALLLHALTRALLNNNATNTTNDNSTNNDKVIMIMVIIIQLKDVRRGERGRADVLRRRGGGRRAYRRG